jgi:hypothetical protein
MMDRFNMTARTNAARGMACFAAGVHQPPRLFHGCLISLTDSLTDNSRIIRNVNVG